MKVFLDTNVLVSALTTRGLCADLVRVLLTEHELVVGEVVLKEFRRVLGDRFRVPAERSEEVDTFLRGFTLAPMPREPVARRVRDPDDDAVLASAEAAGVDYLVTGDADLLQPDLKTTLRVRSPRAFWEELRRGRPG